MLPLACVTCGVTTLPFVLQLNPLVVAIVVVEPIVPQILGSVAPAVPALVQSSGGVAAFAIPAPKNKASELATIGVKNLLEFFVERLFRELFCPPPQHMHE